MRNRGAVKTNHCGYGEQKSRKFSLPLLQKYYTMGKVSTGIGDMPAGLWERDKLKECKAQLEAKKARDKLIAKLDEVDVLVRKLMK
jgi:hypothetical protein